MEQNQLVKGILINEDLFSEKLDEYINKDLEYINIPDSVGIATENINGKKTYIVYLNNELGNNIYNKTTTGFIKAVNFAKEIYEGLKSYNESLILDYTKIKHIR